MNEQLERLKGVKAGLQVAGLWPMPGQALAFSVDELRDYVTDSAESITDRRLLHVLMWVGSMLYAMEASGFDVDG